MGKMYIKTEELFIKLLLLFPIFTLFQSIFFLNWINKVLIVGVFITLLKLDFKELRIKKKWFILLSILLLVHIHALFQTNFPLYNSNMLFYFGFWMLIVIYYADHFEYTSKVIKYNLNYIEKIVFLWSLIVGLSIFFPSLRRWSPIEST